MPIRPLTVTCLLAALVLTSLAPAHAAQPQVAPAATVTAGSKGSWVSCSNVSGAVTLQAAVNGVWKTLARGKLRKGVSECKTWGVDFGAKMTFTAPHSAGMYPTQEVITRRSGSFTNPGPPLLVTAAPASDSGSNADPGTLGPDPGPPHFPPAKSSAYAFGSTFPNGTVAHWNRCKPIHWTLDPTNMSKLGASAKYQKTIWKRALRDISAVTGYTFAYVSPTPQVGKPDTTGNFDIGPGSHRPDVDLVLSYGVASGDPKGYNYAALAGGTAGMGGVKSAQTADGKKAFIRSASLIVDYADLAKFPIDQQSEVMYHELGHTMGLGHSVPGQNMNAIGDGTHPTYEAGDLYGLYLLSRMPCA